MTGNRSILSIACWLLMTCQVVAQQGLPLNGSSEIFLGAGYDNETNTFLDTCLVSRARTNDSASGTESTGTVGELPAEQINVPTDGIRSITYGISIIEDRRDFETSISFAGSAAFQGNSARASFSNSVKINEYSAQALVKVRVVTPPQVLANFALSRDAIGLIETDGNTDRFRRVCGNSFVVSIIRGGELNGFISIETRTRLEKQKIEAQVSGSYSGFSGDASTTSSFETLLDNRQTSAKYFVAGTSGQVALPENLQGLSAYTSKFPGEVFKNSTPYEFTVRSYERVLNFPDVTLKIASDRSEILESLGSQRIRARSLLDNVDYIISNSEQFVEPDLAQLATDRQDLAKHLNAIVGLAQECLRSVDSCIFYETAIIRPRFPDRKNTECRVARSELCGVELYRTERSDACGDEQYNMGSGSICGVKAYKVARNPACNTELFAEKETASCGLGPNNDTNHIAIRDVPIDWPSQPAPGVSWDDHKWRLVYDACEKEGYGLHSGVPFWTVSNRIGSATCDRYRSCRHESHGVAIIEGVEQYRSCEHPSNGKIYGECRNELFGVETYKSCRHASHTPELFKSCLILEDESGLCPK